MSDIDEHESQDHRNNHSVHMIVYGAIALMVFGYVLTQLPEITPQQIEIYQKGTCIKGAWRYGLILTHILTFILIPVAMRIFYEALNNLKLPMKAIFASQLGLSFIMVSIASEIGWHVTQCWYYQNDFTMLNFMFYFFLILALALWANGLSKEKNFYNDIINIIFALSLLIVSFLYPIGYKLDNPNLKIPIYIVLTLIFAVLTYRGYKLLKDGKMILVPVFSVGINLIFIFLLDKFGGDPFHPEILYNALFHILHDLTGTQAGIAIFTWLVYQKGIAKYQNNN